VIGAGTRLASEITWAPAQEVIVRRAIILLALVPFLSALSACGSSSTNSPAAPSSTGNGAVINGSLTSGLGAATMSSVHTTNSPAGMGLTVTIVGTSMSTTVNGAGQFTLRNVPAGHVTVRFSGNGMNGDVDLDDVGDSETITLTLTVNGASVDLDEEHRRGGAQDQLEGKVQALPPTTAAGTFMVAGQLVTTDANTHFFIGGASAQFANLTIGQRVHVAGHVSGNALLASTIQIQGPDNPGNGNPGNGNPNNPIAGSTVQLDGPMGGLKGACPFLTFGVKGTTVFTSGTTVFTPACSTFKSGDKVTVAGVVTANGSVTATTVAKQ